MFFFLSLRIYRRTFFQYLITFILLFFISVSLIFFFLLKNEEQQYYEQSVSFFSNCEENISRCTDSIDRYMNRIYMNPQLLSDFFRFFGNDLETYLISHLYDTDPNTISFSEDIKQLAKETNFLIQSILFVSGTSQNIITYSSTGAATYSFDVPQSETLSNKNNFPTGYIYTKEITDPKTITNTLGTIAFVIDLSRVFPQTVNDSIQNAVAINKSTVIPILNQDHILSNNLSDYTKATTFFSDNPFRFIKYTIHTSSEHGYTLYTAANTWSLLFENWITPFITVLLAVILWGFVFFIILLHLNKDAHAFAGILHFIHSAQNGQFEEIHPNGKKDEYDMIATELDEMGRRISEYIKREYVLTRKQQQALLLAMQNQINPHFLYNTLEIIRSRALQNNDLEVANALQSLGTLFREIVKGDLFISIDQELSLTEKYLSFMKFRYHDRFTYEILVDNEVREIETVKCWMQPIIENYFKHSFDRTNEYNFLLIEGEMEEDHAKICISHNGFSADNEILKKLNEDFLNDELQLESDSIGLKNICARLKSLYGKALQMHIENRSPQGVQITVKIPKEKRRSKDVSCFNC